MWLSLIAQEMPSDCYISFERMNLAVWGFVYEDEEGIIHIIVNDRLATNIQKQVVAHEIDHVVNDFSNDYIITLDMKHCEIEKRANLSSFLSL